MSAVDEALRMFDLYRAGTISEIENIPEENWDFRPGPGARTVRELVTHIGSSFTGFANELLADDSSFMRIMGDADLRARLAAPYESKSKAEVIEVLKQASADASKQLREGIDKIENGTMTSRGGEQSRLSGLWFAAAHEMYHRGQLATYARALGLVPAMTQKSQAAAQQQQQKPA